MKNLVNKPAVFTMLFLCVLAIISCNDPIDDVSSDYSGNILNLTKPEVTSLSLLEGNVEMVLPDGAISKTVIFTAKQCENAEHCQYYLKIVKIDPLVSFDKPIILKLKYNGCLANGYIIPKECIPVINFWETEKDFLDGVEPICVPCFRDSEGATLNFSVMQTGVFAVGNNLPGVTD